MFNKPIWRNIFIAFGWLASISGLVVLMSFIEVKKASVVCKDVKVYIPGNQYFIDKDEVDNIIGVKNDGLVGLKLQNINIHQLENKLRANPFIEFAKVYTDMDGVIMVEISQRQPILRVMNRFDQDFYVDQHGLKIPLSANFTAKVLVTNGNIDELFANRVDSLHTDVAKQLFTLADFIHKDSLWAAQVVQVYVNQNHEMELIPRVGSHRILLGNADSLKTKFENLLVFYKQALPKVGQDTYRIINIKYANQVVGVKNVIAKADSAKAKSSIKADSVKQVKKGIQH